MMSEAPSILSSASDVPKKNAGLDALSISIVIPHFQDLVNLDLCLDLLGKQTIDLSRCHIIIADNASPVGIDAVKAVVGDRAEVVLSTQKGAGATRNVGVSVATGDVLAFIDSDCRPDPSYLERGLERLQAFDLVGGHVRVDIRSPGMPTPTEAFELVFAFRNQRYIDQKHFTVTASLFVLRSVFDSVGPFVNDVSEDMEWCHRARGLGYSLGYASEAVIGHPARYDWSEIARKWRRLTAEAYQLNRMKKHATIRWVLYNWFVLAATLPQCVKIFYTPVLDGLGHRLGAAAIFMRIRLNRFLWAHNELLNDIGRQHKNN